MRECKHLGYCCGEYFCKLRDDVDDLKPHIMSQRRIRNEQRRLQKI